MGHVFGVPGRDLMPGTGGTTAIALTIVVIVFAAGCFNDEGNVFSLRVGQCFDDPDPGASQISDVVIVDCDTGHDNEVFAVFDIAGLDYPGADEVFDTGRRGCAQHFATYVGATVDTTDLAATFLAPTERSWNNREDREVICYLLDRRGAKLDGSMRGTAI